MNIEERIAELKEQLPSTWVTTFLQIFETEFKKRYCRQNAYKILNEGKTDHDGWVVIEGIARRHQESLKKVA
jgi:hypothetical protein